MGSSRALTTPWRRASRVLRTNLRPGSRHEARTRLLALVLAPLLGVGCGPSEVSRAERGLYDITWRSPSASPQDTMPLGNGDFAANVRVEADGTMRLLLSKSDAWSGDGRLLKLGELKIRLRGSGPGAPVWRPGPLFVKTLHVSNATIAIGDQPAGVHLEAWIDASSNVLRVGVSCAESCEVEVEAELWRTQDRPFRDGEQAAAHGSTCPQHVRGVRSDSVVEPHPDLVWLHRNADSIVPDLLKHEGILQRVTALWREQGGGGGGRTKGEEGVWEAAAAEAEKE
jgi:hypothetical protein